MIQLRIYLDPDYSPILLQYLFGVFVFALSVIIVFLLYIPPIAATLLINHYVAADTTALAIGSAVMSFAILPYMIGRLACIMWETNIDDETFRLIGGGI